MQERRRSRIVQIDAGGETFAIAINIESAIATSDPQVRFAQKTAPLAGAAWSAGWHTDASLDYAGGLGMHSGSAFVATPRLELAQKIGALVRPGARVSAFVEGYPTGDGGHKVHKSVSGKDGALAIVPASGSPTYLLFHFAQQTF